ncbi:hypothetical protein B0681_09405 [Moraxella porci DSM 25326]|uniref:DUF4401 domain-containing protein n=1 Tax=Moraxella porci DSM 25326 TaxID=573983 RepID=A0A1T0CNA1_9GAMM|nr:DUF2157 domain-containing protein [Moraxella porci]OOS23830.1 hypothetical protein B0681_09405 [Moraxella porci DSM 25326]
MIYQSKRQFVNLPDALTSTPMAMQWVVFGLIMIAASLIYLMAANWRLLPDEVKLIINPLVMMLCAVMSMRASAMWMSALHTMSALMAGLSLAVIGQVYQTGADGMWLFVLWSVLIAPWLYRVNDASFVLLMAVSQVALWLTVDQMAWDERWYPAWAMVLLLGVWRVFGRCRLSWLVALGLSVLAVYAAISDWFELSVAQVFCTLMVIISPWLFALWAKVRLPMRQMASVAIGVVGGAMAVFCAVVIGFEIESLLVISILAHVWFGLLAYGIYRHFGRKLTQVQTALLAVGGWLTSLFALLWLVADVLMGFDSAWVMTAYAIFILMLGMMMLTKAGRWAYTRHLGYALVAVGVGLSIYAIMERWDLESLWPLIALQSAVLGLLWRVRVHWLYLLMYALFLYGLLAIQSFDVMTANDQPTLMTYGLYALGFLPAVWVDRQVWLDHAHLDVRGVGLWVMALAVGWSLYFGMLDGDLRGVSVPLAMLMASMPLLIGLGLRLSRLPMATTLLLMPLGLMAGFGLAGLLAVILVLAMAVARRDYVSYGLAVCVGIGLLWLIYYQLSLVFLVKFITIFITGCVMIIMGVSLDKRTV